MSNVEDKFYIGTIYEITSQHLKESGIPHRRSKVDGEFRILTRDYRPDRFNFEVENGIITKVDRG